MRLKKTYYHDKASPAVADAILLLDEQKRKEARRILKRRRRQEVSGLSRDKVELPGDNLRANDAT
jgi:hypothetical protein